jgi:hypothetical protein
MSEIEVSSANAKQEGSEHELLEEIIADPEQETIGT